MTQPLMFDKSYFDKLITFLNGKYNETVQDLNSEKVTNNKEKLIFHLKLHIDSGNDPAVEFNSDYSKFKVYSNGVKREFNPNSIDPDFWVIFRKRIGYVPIMGALTSKDITKNRKAKKKTNDNDTEYTEARIKY